MAYNDSEGLVDVFGGRADIEQKVIRCVGNAEERFGEDALRIMRAVRFSAQLGFTVDPDTAKAAKKLAGTLSKISAERIQTELVKLLVSSHPDYLRYAWEYGITQLFCRSLTARWRHRRITRITAITSENIRWKP
mgnify:FL=1